MLAFGSRQRAVGPPASLNDAVVHDPVAAVLAAQVRGGLPGAQKGREVTQVERLRAAEMLVEPGLGLFGLLDAQAGQALFPVGPIVDLDVLGVKPARLVGVLGMFASDWP